jgi:hypothetical protein
MPGVDPATGGTPNGTGGSGAVLGKPGVVVVKSAAEGPVCVALCERINNPELDPDQDGWSYEGGRSCVIPNSPTSHNQACVTGKPLPAPEKRPGVVVFDGSDRACVALCTAFKSPTAPGANDDGKADDWAYENNAACVIPGTLTGKAQSCTTSDPVPPLPNVPGVLVAEEAGATPDCIALCKLLTSPTAPGADDDGKADDWAFEGGRSCIIPKTVTANNQRCMTSEPIPAYEPRPGVMVNSDPVMDSCQTTACAPLCQVLKKGTDPKFPDWGWENNTSCVIPGSRTATELPRGKEPFPHGLTPARRACTWPAPTPDTYYKAPPLDPKRKKSATFRVSGGQLLDPYGKPFVIRGINNSHGWWDVCGQYSAYEALPKIKATGANTVRIGWAFKWIYEKRVIGTTPDLLAEVLSRVVELGMVPFLVVNDTTGQTDATGDHSPLAAAKTFTQGDYLRVLKAYEPYLLIGTGNEWNGGDSRNQKDPSYWVNAHNAAIKQYRNAGIRSPLVITANEWGQGCSTVLDYGAQLQDANLMFDLHTYNYFFWNGSAGASSSQKTGCLNDAKNKGIPVVIGEFGNVHGGQSVDLSFLNTAANNSQGYVAWLWFGDTEITALDLATTWQGPLSSWGNTAVGYVNKSGLAPASIFPAR